MKVTIEEISGNQYTVVRKPFDEKLVKVQLDIGIPVVVEDSSDFKFNINRYLGRFYYGFMHPKKGTNNPNYPFSDECLEDRYIRNTIVTLAALPRKPEPKHAQLLHRYIAEGLTPIDTYDDCEKFLYDTFKGVSYNGFLDDTCECPFEQVTHCIDKDGNKIEVAIDE